MNIGKKFNSLILNEISGNNKFLVEYQEVYFNMQKTVNIKINSTIFQLAAVCRESVGFVFDNLGKDSENTQIETFNDIGNFRVDSSATGFFSFRNEDLFYWIFMKATHQSSSIGLEKLRQEFEVQIKKAELPIFTIQAEQIFKGEAASLQNKPPDLQNLEINFKEEFSGFADGFIKKLQYKLPTAV